MSINAFFTRLFVILGVIGTCWPSYAQAQGQVDLLAGIVFPFGDLADVAKPGASVSVGGGYWFSSRAAVRVDFAVSLPTDFEFQLVVPRPPFQPDVRTAERLFRADVSLQISATEQRSPVFVYFDVGLGTTS